MDFIATPVATPFVAPAPVVLVRIQYTFTDGKLVVTVMIRLLSSNKWGPVVKFELPNGKKPAQSAASELSPFEMKEIIRISTLKLYESWFAVNHNYNIVFKLVHIEVGDLDTPVQYLKKYTSGLMDPTEQTSVTSKPKPVKRSRCEDVKVVTPRTKVPASDKLAGLELSAANILVKIREDAFRLNMFTLQNRA